MPGTFEYQWGQVVAQAWSDPAFKAKLLADPVAVLQENGVRPPAGLRINVAENTDEVLNLVLPAKPPAQELSEEDLQPVGASQRGYESCFRCGESCNRCGESCHRCERC